MSKILRIVIDSPYWGAWKKFGWPKATWGIGINRSKVESAIIAGYDLLEIYIKERKQTYHVSPDEVEKYAVMRNSMHQAKMGTILYIIPESEMTLIEA